MPALVNIHLAVAGPTRSLAFFRAVLGAQETNRGAPPGLIQINIGEARPTLGLRQREARSAAPGMGGIELGFEVEELDAVRTALEAAGATDTAQQRVGWGAATHALTLYTTRP